MVRINLVIDDEIDKQFRMEVAIRLGMKKVILKLLLKKL